MPKSQRATAAKPGPSTTAQDAPVCELFEGDACDRRFPVADYVQTFEFAQFIDLVATAEKPEKAEKQHSVLRAHMGAAPLSFVGSRQDLQDAVMQSADTEQSLIEVLGSAPVHVLAGGSAQLKRAFSVPPPVVEVAAQGSATRMARELVNLGWKLDGAELTRVARQLEAGASVVVTDPKSQNWRVLRPASPAVQATEDAALRASRPLSAPASAMALHRADGDGKQRRHERQMEVFTPRFSAVLPWTQKWKLLGYSRGKLIQSLSLAPQEETTIEFFTWDRRRRSLEQTSQTDTEAATEMSQHQQDSMDTLRELLNGSEMNREIGAQFSASYGSSPQTYVKLDANGKLSGKDSVTQTARTTGKRLAEMTLKASNRVKTQRVSKITESSEFGREERVTRKLRNNNMCRTLSFDYFELMVNYKVETEPDAEGIILCLMLTNPFADPRCPLYISKFGPEHLRIYDAILRPALLNTELHAGFDAARMLAARTMAKQIACEAYGCKKPGGNEDGSASTGGGGTYTPPSFTTLPSWPMALSTGLALADVASALFGASFQTFMGGYPSSGGGGASAAGVLEAKRCVYARLLASQMPDFAAKLDALKAYAGLSAQTPPQDIDGFRQALMDVMLVSPSGVGSGAAVQLDGLRRVPASVIDPILTQERDRIEPFANGGRKDFIWGKLSWWGVANPDDAGLPAALDRFTGALDRFEKARQQTLSPPAATPTPTEAATQQQEAQSTEDRLTFDFPTREVADAMERQDALLRHLDLFLDYYRYVLLRGLPPAEQLSRFVTGLPSDQTTRLLQPRILAWRGSQVAVPVDVNFDESFKDLRDSLEQGIVEAEPVAAFYTSMPTPGVAMETRLGQCSGCEPFIEETREIELRQRAAAAESAEAEARRARMRLEGAAPDLDPPNPLPAAGITVKLEQAQP